MEWRLIHHDGFVAKPIGVEIKRRSRTPNEVFGRAVTELRISKDISQVNLAEALGYSAYYLGRIERGQANISCDVMAAVSDYFKMSIGQFWIYAERLARRSRSRAK